MRRKLKLKPAFPWRPLLLGCHSSRTKTKKQGREADINIAHGHGSTDVSTTIHTDVSTTIQGDFDVAERVKVKVDVDDQNNREKAKAKPSMDKQLSVQDSICLTYKKAISEKAISTPKLGILRLDYNYPPAVGDIDHAESFDYPVVYRVIPGLTFEMCQAGDLSDEVKSACHQAVQYLERQGVSGITGDCGFMIHIQDLISDVTNKPVFMTSLVQLPSLCMCFDSDETIAVFTANSDSLSPLLPRLLEMCALREKDKERIQLVGCQDVDGFEAVEKGEQVDVLKVEAGIVALAKRVIEENPRIKAILLECTELPAYADSLKFATGLPVYDSISVCNSFMAGFLDNPKIGLNDFQDSWDGIQEEYSFGACLTKKEREKLVSKIRRSVRLSIIVNKLRSAVSAD